VKREAEEKKTEKRIKDDEIIGFIDVLIDLLLQSNNAIVKMKTIYITLLALLRFT
jgi:predicted HAD superfamily Cof-like phosphohydrolase